MRSNFGISGNELLLFESYLTDREQQCVANGILSSVGKLKCVVPRIRFYFWFTSMTYHNVSKKPRRVCMLLTPKFMDGE